MSVRIEKDGPIWTIIHSRPEARNAMDPESAEALFKAFQSFDADDTASVAVFWGCLLYTSPSPRDATLSRMPSSA